MTKPWAAWIFFAAFLSLDIASAWAGIPQNAPPLITPLSGGEGPVIWNMNQEISALIESRTPDPDYLPKGIPLGQPWRLYTNFESDLSYDDNVYRAASNSQGDFFFSEIPSLALDYQTNDLHFDIYADATLSEYTKLVRVDNAQYDFGLRGIYAISRAAQVTTNISYSQDAEPLSSPDNVDGQARPTLYNDLNTNVELKYQPTKLGFSLGFNSDIYSYLRTPVFGGGPDVDISYRNNTIFRGFAEADYDFSPGYEGFLRAQYNSDQYQQFLSLGVHRSSTAEDYDAGVKMLLTNLIQGEVYVGYLEDHFDHHQAEPLNDIAGIDFGAAVTWFPTELLTLHLVGDRSIVDTTIPGASGGDDRSVNLTADYELTRRFHLSADADFDDTVYNTTPSNEQLRTVTLGGGAKWLISHYVQATAAYDFSTRDSNFRAYAYHDNLVKLGLNFQI